MPCRQLRHLLTHTLAFPSCLRSPPYFNQWPLINALLHRHRHTYTHACTSSPHHTHIFHLQIDCQNVLWRVKIAPGISNIPIVPPRGADQYLQRNCKHIFDTSKPAPSSAPAYPNLPFLIDPSPLHPSIPSTPPPWTVPLSVLPPTPPPPQNESILNG